MIRSETNPESWLDRLKYIKKVGYMTEYHVINLTINLSILAIGLFDKLSVNISYRPI